MASLLERIAGAGQRLRAAGIPADEATLDARLLARWVLGWDAARLLGHADADESPEFAERYERVVARRERREPIAYITGEREFWSRAFQVSPAVLVPRPETELIVETALAILNGPTRAAAGDRGPLVADIGTGSGCLAVTLACECPSVRVVATDQSQAALDVARGNAHRHGVSSRVTFERADLLDPTHGPFDLIVSNPPYVPDGQREALPPDVREFEPALALFAGPDGLAIVRRLVAMAPARLVPGGSLVFEIGERQADPVGELISATPGLRMIGLQPDLQGIPRTVVVRTS